MKKSVLLITVLLLLEIAAPVGAAVHQTDKCSVVKYDDEGHLIGKVYVNQGSPDANPDYYGDSNIHLYVDKSAPQNLETLRASSFWREDGDDWTIYWWIFPIAWCYPEVHPKKYEDYYDGCADSEWEIYFSDPARYVDGDDIPYNQLEDIIKGIISLLVSSYGLPDPTGLIFALIDEEDDPIFSGVMTDHITVSLKTGQFFWEEIYDAKHGAERTELNFGGANSWAISHNVGYSDWIDFDAKYTVEWGYWYTDIWSSNFVWISLGEEEVYLILVNVVITLSD